MSTRLAGHELLDEGAAYVKAGRWSHRITPRGTGGEGRGKCSCGVVSEILKSGNQRKAWHRDHKEAMKKQAEA